MIFLPLLPTLSQEAQRVHSSVPPQHAPVCTPDYITWNRERGIEGRREGENKERERESGRRGEGGSRRGKEINMCGATMK